MGQGEIFLESASKQQKAFSAEEYFCHVDFARDTFINLLNVSQLISDE